MDSSFDVRTGFLVLGILAAASAAGCYATLRASQPTSMKPPIRQM